MSLKQRILLLFMVLLAAIPLQAANAKRGWTKIELTHVNRGATSLPADLLSRFGAEPVADYGTFSIAYAPRGVIEALTVQASKHNVRVRERDDLDVLRLPGASVDVREGIGDAPPGKLIHAYPPGKPGLFVLQFVGPLRSEWVSELEGLGWTLSRYVPNDGYIVVGTPELIGRTRKLSFVQWLDIFHPYQKAVLLARDGKAHDQVFELPAGPASASGIEAIRVAAEGEIAIYRGSADTLVYARMIDMAAEELLRHEMIISVSAKPTGSLSDERQVMSLTSNLNTAQSQPANPGQYWSWVLSRCPNCSNMPSSTWKVGLADSGLDDGANVTGHADLVNRKYFGITGYGNDHDEECAAGQLLCDAHQHGTLVAGIAVGNGGTGILDNLSFPLGMGIAPTAGAFMTKIFSLDAGIIPDANHLFEWIGDAANNGVTIQNHSWNEYPLVNPGTYSTLSRQYDIAARDGDDALSAARNPILLTISSGNHDQGVQNEFRYLTLPGATAKNVLAVGGLENYRPDAAQCRGTHADSFRNIMRTSRVGTQLAGYVKPDVMAPASQIVSAHTSIAAAFPYCLDQFAGHPEYTGDSGTSFAAPVGAGAALVVKRYLGNTPTDLSPAATKAVLIAGARSVRGGEDHTHEPTVTTIGPIPSQQQGFGRLSFEDILNGAQKPVVLDQSPTRLFTQTGEVFRTRLRVRDSSKPVKIALVWTDMPAMAFQTNPLVNDLNLEVSGATPGQVYIGNRLQVTSESAGEESIPYDTLFTPPYDNVNNVEYFRRYMSTNEEFDVSVFLQNLAGDTDPSRSGFEQDFALAVLNADLVGNGQPVAPVLKAQTKPSATTFVDLNWTPASGMLLTGYDVYRGTNLRNMQFLYRTLATSAVDGPLTANTAYIYNVIAVGPGTTVPGNNDVATTINWQTTPNPGTVVLAQQFLELRQGIDYVRTAAELSINSWAEAINTGVIIRASHMNEMRDKLEQALSTLLAPLPTYQFSDPVAGSTPIRDEDIKDLRNAVH